MSDEPVPIRALDLTIFDDLLEAVSDGRPQPESGDYLGRVLQVQMIGYEALGRLARVLRDSCGLPSVLHPSAPDWLPEQWMNLTRRAMEHLVEANWYLGQAARSIEE